jgi:hypothetical protein
MSDANGSAILAGNPTSDSAVGTTSAPAAANNTPLPVTDSTTTTNQTPANSSWYDAIEDGDLKGYVQNKGWKDPVELANGYRNLEKLLGGEKLPMPKGDDDAEGWARVYDSLGRPKSADEYKLPVPEGDTGEFAKMAASKFHELGLTGKQAQSLAAWYNERGTEMMGQVQQQSAQKTEADISGLKSEWGQAWDENIELGRRAAREYGLDQTSLSKIEQAIGTADLLKLMSRIGRGQTEHTFEGGKSTTSFGMTPEAARERIGALRNDSEWATKYMSGNADAQAEMQRLMRLAYPE